MGSKSKKDLFIELAQPNESGCSRMGLHGRICGEI